MLDTRQLKNHLLCFMGVVMPTSFYFIQVLLENTKGYYCRRNSHKYMFCLISNTFFFFPPPPHKMSKLNLEQTCWKVWGSHGGSHEASSLLECDAMSVSKQLLVFWRSIVPSARVQKSRRHFKIISARRVTWSRFHTKDPHILGTTTQNVLPRICVTLA